MPKVDVIVGGQYGSEAKGQMAGWLGGRRNYDLVISNSGSQAGHTFTDDNGDKIVTRHVPIAGVLNRHATILIGPAAIIDVDVLLEEIERHNLYDRIFIHPNAAIIRQEDKAKDQILVEKIGSTGKGNGPALCSKLMRHNQGIVSKDLDRPALSSFIIDHAHYTQFMVTASNVLIEGAQGFSLSIDERFYPYGTSRNCWVGQCLADAWVHPSMLRDTFMVIRTYPIRVAGPSGPCYEDQQEITWESLGREPEITTVTQRVRRVFTFSMQQLIDAAKANRPNYIAISHLDYLLDHQRTAFIAMVIRIVHSSTGIPFKIITGQGPKEGDWQMLQGYEL